MRSLRAVTVFCWLLLASSSSVFASEPQWIEVRSDHFTVITDSGEKDGRHVADLFEQMRAAFGVVFVRNKINQPVALQIIAFRNTKEFRQYSPLFKGKVVELSGFFQMSEDKNFIMVDMSQENNWQIVYHEYAHLWLEGNFPKTAPWFDEGFAEYLSTMKVSNGTVEVGRPIPGAELLNLAKKFSLLDLFEVQHHSETYNQNGESRDMFYVESWLVAHYLMDNLLFAQTANYFRLTNQEDLAIPEAVQKAYGMPLIDLQNKIWASWHSGKFFSRTYKDKIPTTFNATAKPLDSLEARAALADFHAHSMDYQDKAIQEFEDILHANPNLAGAQRGLGYAYLRKHDYPKAAEHFRAATKLGSTDPRAYFFSAYLIHQTQPDSVGSPEFTQDQQRAVELDPQYADAYSLLALGQMRQQDYADAEKNLRHAVELSPRNEMYQLNLAAVLLNQRKVDEGKTVLTPLSHSANVMVAEQANQMLSSLMSSPELASRASAPSAAAPAASAEAAKLAEDRDTKSAVLHDTDSRPMAFVSGNITAVDCSADPGAVLSVLSAGKTYHLHIADRNKVVLINADKFSCEWKNVKADANYRDSGNLQGDVVSLELQ